MTTIVIFGLMILFLIFFFYLIYSLHLFLLILIIILQIIDIHQKCLYKTLRAAHESVSLNYLSFLIIDTPHCPW